jgi:hypothetical protein
MVILNLILKMRGYKKTKSYKVVYTSVSQPPGRIPVPGLGDLPSRTSNVFEKLKFPIFVRIMIPN